MKSKLLLIVLSSVLVSSCIKDFTGTISDNEKIELTSDNYIYEGDLEKFYINNEIEIIDAKIKDANEEEQKELMTLRADLKQRLALIIDLAVIMKTFPIPCDIPGGKCVPVRFEYLIFDKNVVKVNSVFSSIDGKTTSNLGKLNPLPGYESELQYAYLPKTDFGKEILIEIEKLDKDGFKSSYSIVLGN